MEVPRPLTPGPGLPMDSACRFDISNAICNLIFSAQNLQRDINVLYSVINAGIGHRILLKCCPESPDILLGNMKVRIPADERQAA